jgi:hypothetical protein
MQRLWSSEELAERWSLGSEELVLLPGKSTPANSASPSSLPFTSNTRDFPKMNPTSRPR